MSAHTGAVDPDLSAISARVQASLYYPPVARRLGRQGVVRVRFHVDGAGRPESFSILRSAGDLLDDAAEKSVRRAAPLPAPNRDLVLDVRFFLAESP